jgi:hypothetical protein
MLIKKKRKGGKEGYSKEGKKEGRKEGRKEGKIILWFMKSERIGLIKLSSTLWIKQH